jgi:OOP family OmpA-OmpF porin
MFAIFMVVDTVSNRTTFDETTNATADVVEPAEPAQLAVVLDQPTSHFVSLFSPDRTMFITGQLFDPGWPTIESAELVYAPDDDGAVAVVDAGRLALEGDVPDQKVADLLLEEFALIGELGESEVENRLEVVAGAPNPSGRIIIQDDLLFDVGSAELAGDGNSSLALVVKFFTARPDWHVTIIGHTDNTGSEVTNLGLSQARAETVRARLIELGVREFALEALGVGDSQPVADNDTEAGRESNRRIEFQVRSRSGG